MRPSEHGWITYDEYIHYSRKDAVKGELLACRNLHSPQLNNSRDIFLHLPLSYRHDLSKRYPVFYLHDGQNLFDEAMSFAGDWHVDETMVNLSLGEGIEAIVVGITSINDRRSIEYGPTQHSRYAKRRRSRMRNGEDGRGGAGGGKERVDAWGPSNADAYLDFIEFTIKPMIDEEFRTLSGRENTGIMGSSMGGLISMYAYATRKEVFGMAGVLSPSLWYGGGEIYEVVREASAHISRDKEAWKGGRVYLDVGEKEHPGMQNHARSMRDMLSQLPVPGFLGAPFEDSFMYFEDWMGNHSEAAWAHRFPIALRFLLTGIKRTT
ncbi:putative esterase [Cladochytrium replicatum]|nr:putative esterase [Cladochytrium replicatum]